ncbi:MAG: hypothetical protein HQ528_04070 [Candidatus Marinimicrobia bacterium]|nr:hypothetical protein [Candidatus Neomarinimicrobiota bacterium]
MRKSFILSLLVLPILLAAQEVQPKITTEKMRLLILPSTSETDYQDIADRVTAIVASKATQLGRFEVIDRNNLESIMDEQALQLSGLINDEEVVEIGKIAAAPEALLVTVLNFGQKGVPPEDEEDEDKKDRKKARESGLLGIIAKEVVDAAIDKKMEKVERYPNNIQTTLSCEVRKIDLESGQSIDAFTLNVEHTGGNKTASLNKVLNQASWRVSQQLKELYILSSQIVDIQGRNVILLLGKDMGVKKGTMFSVNSPSSKRTVGNKSITIPGHQVGIIEVTDISVDANQGRILRNWETIEPGYPAVESTGRIMAGGLGIKFGTGSPEMGLDLAGYINPLGRLGGSVFFGLGTLKDSRDDTDFSLRFGVDMHFRLINTIPFSLAGYLSLPLNFVMRSDDDPEDSHTVSAIVFGPIVGGQLEFMLSSNMDLVASVGYCMKSDISKWDYSEDDDDDESQSYPAFWDDDLGAPDIDLTGLYFNVGIRFLLFGAGSELPSLSELQNFR